MSKLENRKLCLLWCFVSGANCATHCQLIINESFFNTAKKEKQHHSTNWEPWYFQIKYCSWWNAINKYSIDWSNFSHYLECFFFLSIGTVLTIIGWGKMWLDVISTSSYNICSKHKRENNVKSSAVNDLSCVIQKKRFWFDFIRWKLRKCRANPQKNFIDTHKERKIDKTKNDWNYLHVWVLIVQVND